MLEQKLLSARLRVDTAESEEEEAALKWRRVILKLTANFNTAAGERSDLSPVLMEALHHALENLLLHGDEAQLLALEEWVDQDRLDHQEAQDTANRNEQEQEQAQ
jgi:hypothetical protein